jgi:hypothetical protein
MAAACISHRFRHSKLPVLVLALATVVAAARAQLSPTFYASSCPAALVTINAAVRAAVLLDRRMGASLLRLHFHDCFVQASQSTAAARYFVNSCRSGHVTSRVSARVCAPGLRRVRSAGRHGQLHRGEERGPQRGLAQGVRRHRHHQGPAGGAVPADRVVRRHPRRRRP